MASKSQTPELGALLEKIWKQEAWVLAVPRVREGEEVRAILRQDSPSTGTLLNHYLFEDEGGLFLRVFPVDNPTRSRLKVLNFAARCLGCRPKEWAFNYSVDDDVGTLVRNYASELDDALDDAGADFDTDYSLFQFPFLDAGDEATKVSMFLDEFAALHKAVDADAGGGVVRVGIAPDGTVQPFSGNIDLDAGALDTTPCITPNIKNMYFGPSDMAYLPAECLSENTVVSVQLVRIGADRSASVIAEPTLDIAGRLPRYTALQFRLMFLQRQAALLDLGEKYDPPFSVTTVKKKKVPKSLRFPFLLTQDEYTRLRVQRDYWVDDNGGPASTKEDIDETKVTHLEVEAVLQPGSTKSVNKSSYMYRVINTDEPRQKQDTRVVKALRIRLPRKASAPRTLFTTDTGEENVAWAVWRPPSADQYRGLAEIFGKDAVWAYVGWKPLKQITTKEECLSELERRDVDMPTVEKDVTSLVRLKERVKLARLNGIDVQKMAGDALVNALQLILNKDYNSRLGKLRTHLNSRDPTRREGALRELRDTLQACLLVDPTPAYQGSWLMYRHTLVGEADVFWDTATTFAGFNYPDIKFGKNDPSMMRFGVGLIKLSKNGIRDLSRLLYPGEYTPSAIPADQVRIQKQTALSLKTGGQNLNFHVPHIVVRQFVATYMMGTKPFHETRVLTLPKMRNKDLFALVALARALKQGPTGTTSKTATYRLETSLELVQKVVVDLSVKDFGEMGGGQLWTKFVSDDNSPVHPIQNYKEILFRTYTQGNHCHPEDCVEAIANVFGIGVVLLDVGDGPHRFHASCHALYKSSRSPPQCWVVAQMNSDKSIQLVVQRHKNGRWKDMCGMFPLFRENTSTTPPRCNATTFIDISDLAETCTTKRRRARARRSPNRVRGWIDVPGYNDVRPRLRRMPYRQIVVQSGECVGVLVPLGASGRFIHLPIRPCTPRTDVGTPDVYLDRTRGTFHSTLLARKDVQDRLPLANCEQVTEALLEWSKHEPGYAVRFVIDNRLLLACGEVSISSSICPMNTKTTPTEEAEVRAVKALAGTHNGVVPNKLTVSTPTHVVDGTVINNDAAGSTVSAVQEFMTSDQQYTQARLVLLDPEAHRYDRVLIRPMNVVVPLSRPVEIQATGGDAFSGLYNPPRMACGIAPYTPSKPEQIVRSLTFNYDALRALLPKREAWRAQGTSLHIKV